MNGYTVNLYKERFMKIVKIINSNHIKEYAPLNNEKSFTRKRKMPLKDIILSALSKNGLTTDMELHKYFIDKGVNSINISKQGFLQ